MDGYVGAASSAASSIGSAVLSYQQGKIQKIWYDTNKYIADINSKIAEMEAENLKLAADFQKELNKNVVRDITRKGQTEEGLSRQKTSKVIGSQRAALAAQGIRIDEGSARDIQLETSDIGDLDAMNIRNNAAKQAFGYTLQGDVQQRQIESQMFAKLMQSSAYKMQGIGYELGGKLAVRGANTEAAQTLMTGALKTYDYYSGTQTSNNNSSWEYTNAIYNTKRR